MLTSTYPPTEKKFQRSRYLPSQDLDFFVGYYWIVRWDLHEDDVYLSETLPQPCVHLVFEHNQSRVVGINTSRFSYLLANTGLIFGVSFKPGAFFPFLRKPISTLTDTSIDFCSAFGTTYTTLEHTVLSQADEAQMIALVENFLYANLPTKDEHVTLINQMVDRIIADREITRVDHLVSQFHINKRSLQRLFNQYIGIHPKWVINRYRLQEAAERIAQSVAVDWSKLALDLGYFDQAHLINDFKLIIGKTPAEYIKHIHADPDSFLTCDMLRKVPRSSYS